MSRGIWGVAAAIAVIAAVLAWLIWLGPLPPQPLPPAPQGPPAEVLARLDRGVNLSGWLQHGDEDDLRARAPTAADWRLMRGLGLRHVRIPVDTALLVGARGMPRRDVLARLREAVAGATQEDLLVVLTLQLPAEAKQRLGAGEPERFALGGQWRALAAALRGFSPRQLVLEPLNEPELEDAAASRALLAHLVVELRAVLPWHTLVVAGHRYSGIDELLALQPLADPNLVYAFHFYEPYVFTHQGATWGDPLWRTLRGVPYPSSPEAVAPRLAPLAPAARDRVRWHGEERWNRAKLAARLELARQWGARNQVPVWCGEFGVLRKAPPADRAAWLRDAREELEKRGIGWSHWDWRANFGIVAGGVPDPRTVEALGLRADAPR